MKKLISSFTNQLRDAINIGNNAKLTQTEKKINNIVITGLGGSGIGGKIVAQLVRNEIDVPVSINNGYHLPAFVGENTLVIVSSFSGNTEETLEAMQIALERNAEIACISSGGKVIEIAQEKALNHIILPECHSPRAMLTYSLTQQFFLLNHYGFINESFKTSIGKAAELIDSHIESIQQEAEKIAKGLQGKTAVIYSEEGYEGVAIRLRQQLNENAKVLAWHHYLPEMNHNELVGWAGGKEEYAVILFRNDSDYSRTQRRMEISKEVIEKYTNTHFEVWSKGDDSIQKSLYLIVLGDWISIYLAELQDVDPIEIKVINYLKGELAKI
jgi:glucose/mannose-6-phosphate isomerase